MWLQHNYEQNLSCKLVLQFIIHSHFECTELLFSLVIAFMAFELEMNNIKLKI